METETRTKPATYDEWLAARRRFGRDPHTATYSLYVLEVLAESGGQWTVGTDSLVYLHCGMDPRPYLRKLVLHSLAVQTGTDTWAITDAGMALDCGRPNRGQGPRLHTVVSA